MNSVVVTTAQSVDPALGESFVISVELNDGSRLVTGHKFRYRHNPRITDITPTNHLIVCVYTTLLHCPETRPNSMLVTLMSLR